MCSTAPPDTKSVIWHVLGVKYQSEQGNNLPKPEPWFCTAYTDMEVGKLLLLLLFLRKGVVGGLCEVTPQKTQNMSF